jgi:hypothetical protein
MAFTYISRWEREKGCPGPEKKAPTGSATVTYCRIVDKNLGVAWEKSNLKVSRCGLTHVWLPKTPNAQEHQQTPVHFPESP